MMESVKMNKYVGMPVLYFASRYDAEARKNDASFLPGVITQIWDDGTANIRVFQDDSQPPLCRQSVTYANEEEVKDIEEREEPCFAVNQDYLFSVAEYLVQATSGEDEDDGDNPLWGADELDNPQPIQSPEYYDKEGRDTIGEIAEANGVDLEEAKKSDEPTEPWDEEMTKAYYSDFTKAELYDLAQQREIEGRASMSKSELIKALSE